jgi:hypothetical protein
MPTAFRRSLLAALLVLIAIPAAAQARAEVAVFTVELSGSYSYAWNSPGVASCNAPDPSQVRGSLTERMSFRTESPVPILVQGLWGKDLQFFNMRGEGGDSGVPVQAEMQRQGSVERLTCKPFNELPRERWRSGCSEEQVAQDPVCQKVIPLPQESCFGERRWAPSITLALAPFKVYPPGDIDHRVFDCTAIDPSFRPDSAIETMTPGLKTGPQKFKSAKAGAKWTLHAREVQPCRRAAPATCTPAVLEVQATFRFVCRSPTQHKGCLTKKLRRSLELHPSWGG